MDKSKDWWGDTENAKKWIDQNKKRTVSGDFNTNTTVQSTEIVINEILSRQKDFSKILEVGSGDGRLIGKLSHGVYGDCYCIDINEGLIKYIKGKYQNVKTNVGDVAKLPFRDNSFDLVFTYQVLQHVHPDYIKQALSELKRIAKKEVWMWEGIGRVDGYENGAMTSKVHNGSWVWKIDEMIDCYDVSIPKNDCVSLY